MRNMVNDYAHIENSELPVSFENRTMIFGSVWRDCLLTYLLTYVTTATPLKFRASSYINTVTLHNTTNVAYITQTNIA